jgi:hypothetical protein
MNKSGRSDFGLSAPFYSGAQSGLQMHVRESVPLITQCAGADYLD